VRFNHFFKPVAIYCYSDDVVELLILHHSRLNIELNVINKVVYISIFYSLCCYLDINGPLMSK